MISFLPYFFEMQYYGQTIFIGLGFAILTMVYFDKFLVEDYDSRRSSMWAFLTGLMVLLFLRYSNYSINPLFSIFEFCAFSIAFTVFTVGFLYAFDSRSKETESFDGSALTVSLRNQRLYMSFFNDIEEDEDNSHAIPKSGWRYYMPEVGFGCSFGAALFLMNMFFTGYSVLPRWSGLEPYPYALISIFFLTVGICLGAAQIFHTIFAWAFIVISIGLLCFSAQSVSFFGGCIIALLTPSFLFSSLLSFDVERPSFAILSSLSSNFLLSLFVRLVMDPAYSRGVFFARPWIPLLVAGLFLALSLVTGSTAETQRGSKCNRYLRVPSRLVFFVLFLASPIGFLPSTMVRASGKVVLPRAKPIIPVVPMGVQIPADNSSGDNDTYHETVLPAKPFSVVQLNIRQGYDEDGFTNLDRILEYFESSAHPSIVGLQEIETNYMWTGSVDIVEYLSYKLQMNTVYGSNPRESTLGAAILTKLQLQSYNSQCFEIPLAANSPSSCVSASLRFVNRSTLSPLDIFVTQLRDDDTDSKSNEATEIANMISLLPENHAVIWLGEFHSPEDQIPDPLTRLLFASCRIPDSSSFEYQFYRNLNASSNSCGDPNLSSHVPFTSSFT
jgi:hypothetical protein